LLVVDWYRARIKVLQWLMIIDQSLNLSISSCVELSYETYDDLGDAVLVLADVKPSESSERVLEVVRDARHEVLRHAMMVTCHRASAATHRLGS